MFKISDVLCAFTAIAVLAAAPTVAQSLISPAPVANPPVIPLPATPPPVLVAPKPAAPAVAAPVVTAPVVTAPATIPGSVAPAQVITSAPQPVPQLVDPNAPAVPGQAIVKPKPKKKPAPPAPPREMAISDDPMPSFQPETFFATAQASERYAIIADAGGWPKIPGALTQGGKGRGVTLLRQRLAMEGDLEQGAAATEIWDPALTAGVKRFQFRNGLRQTGNVTGATLRAINVSAAIRFRQLASSAQRLAGLSFPFGERYVVVNIPSTAVEAIDNGRVAHRYVAIVGDVDHRSPEVEARISAVNLNPTWTVPTSIIKNEIIPKMRKDPGYLSRAKIRILNGQGAEVDAASVDWSGERAVNYTLRQDSGAGNSLGSIRIQMNNKYSVYMHDTPSKRLFGADYRFLSHGCVRVQGVYDLASWLLEGTGGSPSGTWSKDAILAKISTAAREDVRLARNVPVIWVYMTGWASADGLVHFRDDVYQVDSIGENQAKIN